MAAVAPLRQGILLNPSPSSSPYQSPSSLPLLVPSNCSLSSSSSSQPATDSESSSSPPRRPATGPRAQSHSGSFHKPRDKPRADSTPAAPRRIRFAPLPDPRRDFDGPAGLPPVFLDDDEQPHTPLAIDTATAPAPPSVPENGPSSAPSSLRNVSTDTDAATPTSLRPASSLPATACLADLPPASGESWSRKLLRPLLGPLARSRASTEDVSLGVRFAESAPDLMLARAESNASTASTASVVVVLPRGRGRASEEQPQQQPAEESKLFGLIPMRSRSASRPRKPPKEQPEWVREFGAPLGRWSSAVPGEDPEEVRRRNIESDRAVANWGWGTPAHIMKEQKRRERERLDEKRRKKDLKLEIKEAKKQGPDAVAALKAREEARKNRIAQANATWKAGNAGAKNGVPLVRSQSLGEKSQPSGMGGGRGGAGARRPQQRMLNGRVYGARRNQDLFASARSDEPEFVEWGYGGMGSVKAAASTTMWAKVQGSGVSVGAHDSGGEGWGARARAASAAVDGAPAAVAAGRSHAATDPEDDGSGMAWLKRRREQREREKKEHEEHEEEKEKKEVPQEKENGKEEVQEQTEEVAPSRTSIEKTLSQEHITTAVTLPALYHHHSHHHHHGSHVSAEAAPGVQPEGEQRERARADSVSSESTMSGGSAKKDDADAFNDEEGDEEGDEELELEEDDERTRRTALGAGIEKISRHIAEGAHHHPDVHTPDAAAPAPAAAPPGPEEARAREG
ncbi:hypothetical protein OBBRIDRAFT_836065 [Obba rivulosa]|uniref:Uncharacterized protein n=1 Tax=Obba rivulosa TaxID=1052685 RepID=A0A8E2AR37_9APHY|nr:hypothetical protein OBBRIDRAFT_836065 [Obba rivulosa]